MVKQFDHWRQNGQDLIPEVDEWVDACLAVKAMYPKPTE